MTILIIISIIYASSLFSDANVKVPQKDASLCKIFQDKIKTYKKTMRDDEYAVVTLASYEKRAKIYCPDK